MNTDFIKGVIVPILTPVNENEFIDEAKLRDQVNYVIEGGVLGPGGRPCTCIFWNRCDQHQKVLPPCSDGGAVRCGRHFRAAAHVLKAN